MTRQISETVLHATYDGPGPDTHGNASDSWGTAEPVGIYAFDPGGSSEPAVPGYDRVITKPTLFMPSTVVFGSRDQVTVRGVVYEVDGDTAVWRHPNGSVRANVAELKKVSG